MWSGVTAANMLRGYFTVIGEVWGDVKVLGRCDSCQEV